MCRSEKSTCEFIFKIIMPSVWQYMVRKNYHGLKSLQTMYHNENSIYHKNKLMRVCFQYNYTLRLTVFAEKIHLGPKT